MKNIKGDKMRKNQEGNMTKILIWVLCQSEKNHKVSRSYVGLKTKKKNSSVKSCSL